MFISTSHFYIPSQLFYYRGTIEVTEIESWLISAICGQEIADLHNVPTLVDAQSYFKPIKENCIKRKKDHLTLNLTFQIPF